MKIRSSVLILGATFLVLLTQPMNTVAQDRNPTRGLKAGNAYSISEIENVNLSNGNLMLNIPVAELPGGRGTSPGYTVTLRYNSKLWNAHQERGFDNIPDDNGNGYYFKELLESSQDGGWHLDAGEYQLNVINRQSLEAEAHCTVGNASEYTRNGYRYRLEMKMPDGSVKEFRPYGTGAPFQDLYGDAWFSIDPNGTRHAYSLMDWNGGGTTCSYQQQQITTAGMHYYSSDGSGLRLFIPYGQYTGIGYFTGTWKLYLSDGSLVENKPADDPAAFQRLTDRNGNKILWKADSFGRRIENEVGQYVSYGLGGVRQPGVNGEFLETTFHWGERWVHREYRTTFAPNSYPGNRTAYIREGLFILEKIVLPQQIGGLEYRFSYNGPETMPNWGDYTNGWGELDSVTLPSGARAEYAFVQDVPSSPLTAMDAVSNAVSRRDLTYSVRYDGTTREVVESTRYSIEGFGSGSVTTPDGGVQTEVAAAQGNLSGYPFRITDPSGTITEKIWLMNYAPRVFAGGAATNPYVKTEFRTVPDANGSPSLTAIKDFDYDKNGNVLEIREYDWVPYSSIPRNGGPALPTTGLVLKRRTTNTYYNPTPIASDFTSDNPNHYANPSSPRLHHVLKSTEIRNENGTPVSRTEFFYDDPNNKGNLRETRAWDSSKGPYSASLTAANSVSTFSEYDQYGNLVKTIDARGVESVVTFGDVAGPNSSVTGLYPTQTVIAANYPSVRRTSTSSYDFYTGVVTRSTDGDNNVSTFTEYDALGRRTRIRTAAGTPDEAWEQTEYDDVNRFVVVRSDVEAIGDGRKVSTQFFDQLGRVRLSKTLEDATQSATNETDGVKVETRYGYNDPTSDPRDPENTLGIYTLVSKPFRAAYATQASNEPTMGWTLSYAHKTGRHTEQTTFDGAALPAAFDGGNLNSTGVITTDIERNATTVTDQAGRSRRSLIDALGLLIRVDEPDAIGSLGTISAPAQPTYYSYNATGKMTHVLQGTQSRYFLYDSLGRLTRARQPEQEINGSLTTSGNLGNNSWTAGFTYDAAGNLLTSQDASNVTITTTYDALSRPVSRVYSDSTPAVSLIYDDPSVAGSRGRLTKISSIIAETRYLGYDAFGRVVSSEQRIDGRGYPSAYKYDRAGAIIEQTYPSGRVVRNFLETDGNLAAIASRVTNAAFRNYAGGFSYTPSGAIKHLQLGNGLWESARLNAREQVTELNIGNSQTDGSVLRLNYHYGELDANGNVDTTHNTGNIARQTIIFAGLMNPLVQTYKYDPLHRIIDAVETSSGSQTWRQAFGYDPYGNRISFSQSIGNQQLPINNLTLPQIDPNTNRFRSGQGYSYDPVGNLTADPTGRTFVFNGDNKQIEIRDSSSAVIAKYFYDADGRRVKKIIGSQTTVFVYDAFGKLVAEMTTSSPVQQPTVNYTATDTLGSPRIITNARGEVVSRRDFMPFGEELAADGTYRTTNLKYGVSDGVRQKFTGYQRDSESDLDFAEARYYNSHHGRFTAVDPLLASGKSADPQTLNRYAYVMNRPLVHVDPSGLQVGKPADPEIVIPKEVTETATQTRVENTDGSTTILPDSLINLKRQLARIAYVGQAMIANQTEANRRAGGELNPEASEQRNDTTSGRSSSETRQGSVSAEVSGQGAKVGGTASGSETETKSSGASAGTVIKGQVTNTTAAIKELNKTTNLLIANYLSANADRSGLLTMKVEQKDGSIIDAKFERSNVKGHLDKFVEYVRTRAMCDFNPAACRN